MWLPGWLGSACNEGGQGLIPELGKSPGERSDYPVQYPYLKNSMGRGAWWATIHGMAESDMIE